MLLVSYEGPRHVIDAATMGSTVKAICGHEPTERDLEPNGLFCNECVLGLMEIADLRRVALFNNATFVDPNDGERSCCRCGMAVEEEGILPPCGCAFEDEPTDEGEPEGNPLGPTEEKP